MNMMNIQVVVWLNEGVQFFGPTVGSLQEARMVVKVLDWLCEVNQLPSTLQSYSNACRVSAVDNEGHAWDYADSDPSGTSDGIWFEATKDE